MVKLYSQYLHDNEDFLKFLDKVSDNTGKKLSKTWMKNLLENRELFAECGWACDRLQDIEQGKTAVIMGASPAIQKQVDQLRELQNDPEFVLCAISSNLKWLLDNGITPRYCLTVDADPSQGEFWKDMDMDRTKDVILISNIYSYPEMLKEWKGPLYFLAFEHANRKIALRTNKYYAPINGHGKGFPTLMSQYNILTAFAFSVLNCPILIFVGNELSFQKPESKFYVDRTDPREGDYKAPHMDIYGNIVASNFGLMALKIALEAFLGTISGAGWFFNCTEAGIFGITKRYKDYHVPWIRQLTLRNGIAQARQIMRTGEPFTFSPGSIIKKPSLHETLAISNGRLQ